MQATRRRSAVGRKSLARRLRRTVHLYLSPLSPLHFRQVGTLRALDQVYESMS